MNEHLWKVLLETKDKKAGKFPHMWREDESGGVGFEQDLKDPRLDLNRNLDQSQRGRRDFVTRRSYKLSLKAYVKNSRDGVIFYLSTKRWCTLTWLLLWTTEVQLTVCRRANTSRVSLISSLRFTPPASRLDLKTPHPQTVPARKTPEHRPACDTLLPQRYVLLYSNTVYWSTMVLKYTDQQNFTLNSFKYKVTTSVGSNLQKYITFQ